ncbi:50S ribosomal protein 5, chloroplastic [Linum perenne]
MALVLLNVGTPLWSSPCCSASTSAKSISKSFPRLHMKTVYLQSKPLDVLSSSIPIASVRSVRLITRATSDIDGPTTPDSTEASSDSGSEEKVSVDKLPLESKLQLRVEQQAKMKLARKIRLRRKRLVRKRKLRKKGRWPPSKMKKLKNV